MKKGTDEVHECDSQYIESLIRHAEETRRLFGNRKKLDREKMILRGLLRCLRICFDESEIRPGPQEPVDVGFRSAAFQVTEVLDSGRLRADEYKNEVTKLREAGSLTDLMQPWENPAPLGSADLVQVVHARLAAKCTKLGGPNGCRGIDALVYVNLKHRFLWPNTFSATPDLDRLRAQGWRSASVLMLPYGIVLFAQREAPEFLRSRSGMVELDPSRVDGWFEP